MGKDKNVYFDNHRYLIVVDELQNYKLRLLTCHHINAVDQLVAADIVVVVVAISINLMNKEIIRMVKLNQFIL
jgi:hypothetical protein